MALLDPAQVRIRRGTEIIRLPFDSDPHAATSDEGQSTHPSIVDAYTVLGEGNAWNGYRYLLAYTPYPFGDDDYEDPCLVASNDGETWEEIPGSSNTPITAWPGSGFHSDVDIVLTSDGTLHLFYRYTTASVVTTFKYRSTTDGVTWTNEVDLFTPSDATTLSPAVVYHDGTWRMWTVRASENPNVLELRTASAPTGPWSAASDCTFSPAVSGADLWHIDANWSEEYGEWHLVAVYTESGTSSGLGIGVLASSDGVDWTASDRYAILRRSGQFDANLYRPTMTPIRTGYDLWYGVISSANTWYVVKGEVSTILDPATETVADTFDRDDSASSLGSADTGQAWEAITGTWGIASNLAYPVALDPTASSHNIAVIDAGGADCEIAATVGASVTGVWRLIGRCADRTTCMIGYYFSGQWRIGVLIHSSFAELATSGAVALTIGDRVRFRCYRNTFTLYVNDVQRVQTIYTTAGISTKFGIGSSSTANRFDDFSLTPLYDPPIAGTLTAGTPTHDSVTLTWTDHLEGKPPVMAQLQRSLSGADDWSNVAGSSPVTDSGLTFETAYDYRVVWTDADEATATSETVTITTDEEPFAAGVLTASAITHNSVTLTWTTTTGGTAPITAQLQRSPSGASEWSNLSGASPATDSGLEPETAYDYRVVWTDAEAATATSNSVTVTTAAETAIPVRIAEAAARLSVEKDRTVHYLVTLREEYAEASFSGNESLTLVAWPGGQVAAYSLAGSTVAWADASAHTITITFDESDTPLFSPGDQVAVLIEIGSSTLEIYRATLEVIDSPDEGTTPSSYCSLSDMRAECSWIESISGGADRGGYLRQRALAREWTDAILQSAYPVLQQERWDVFATAPALGLNVWLQQQLDADNLVLTGPYGRRIVRANALYACHLVLRDEVSRSKEKSHYQALADTFHREALAALQGITAGIDTNDDGIADVQIPLSVQRILRG